MLRLAVLIALGLAAATGMATAQTPASAGQQGKMTRFGEPPSVTAGGQTNWASHNLDPYNQRFAKLSDHRGERQPSRPTVVFRCACRCQPRPRHATALDPQPC